MERVQFQQEQMLAELKDLVQKGLFTEKETKQIMKKRTAFETALVRRAPKKNDFLRYAAYEMGLEALRRKRAERIKLQKGPPTVSDYALVRRQFHIFERALKKFKADIGLWIQYIQVAKKEGARSLVGRITARALQLFPNIPTFYILAAAHELEYLSPSAARSLLQRGIRMNNDSVEMWREYVKMELGFVESMRRRWSVLGIDVDGKDKGKGKERISAISEGEAEQMQVDAEEEGDESEAARREILQGAIVKSVISSAVKALPKPELLLSLNSLLITFPSPQALRSTLLDYLYTVFQDALPHDPQVVKLSSTRHLTPGLSGPELVDKLKEANEKLAGAVRAAVDSPSRDKENAEELAEVYSQFVDDWCRKEDLDLSLKAYLLGSLRSTTQRAIDASVPLVPLLTTHVRLLADLSSRETPIPLLPPRAKIIKLARKYTSLPEVRSNADVWLARLNAERALTQDDGEVERRWKEARENVHGDAVAGVWLWGINEVDQNSDKIQSMEALLSESLRMQDSPSREPVHEKLLMHYASLVVKHITFSSTSDAQNNLTKLIQRFQLSYLPTSSVWSHVFTLVSSSASELQLSQNQTRALLQQIFTSWHSLSPVDSHLTYATWLLKNGHAKESVEVIQRCLKEIGSSAVERVEVEKKWRQVLDTVEQEKTAAAEKDGDKEGDGTDDEEEGDHAMAIDADGGLKVV
ncbi:hypothetical protein K474DRAFT_1721714 [Panus rudis PR-1116 ss-1]|nr:hypothetical protein K474DRAFT_1721714 [Panus rudis PR-1116 ss-1]